MEDKPKTYIQKDLNFEPELPKVPDIKEVGETLANKIWSLIPDKNKAQKNALALVKEYFEAEGMAKDDLFWSTINAMHIIVIGQVRTTQPHLETISNEEPEEDSALKIIKSIESKRNDPEFDARVRRSSERFQD